MLSALEDAAGSFPEAIAICERLLDARGHVYPSTLDRVTLGARTRDGRVAGRAGGRVPFPHGARARVAAGADRASCPYAPALDAIREADLVVLGPGSLFTSIVPNLLVPGVVDAVRASRGRVLFVCSLADMQGETWGLTAREHVEALMDHGMRGLLDYVLVHTPVPLRPDSPATGRFSAATGARAGARLAFGHERCAPFRARAARVREPTATSMAIQQRRARWSSRATWWIRAVPRGTIRVRCATRFRGC